MSVDFNLDAVEEQLYKIAGNKMRNVVEEYMATYKQLFSYEINVHNTSVLAWSKNKNVKDQLIPTSLLPKIVVKGDGLEYTMEIIQPDTSGLNNFQKEGLRMITEANQAKMRQRKFGGDA